MYYYLQWGADDPFHQGILSIVSKQLKSIAFEYLRTTKQLGYRVSMDQVSNNDVMGLTITIVGVSKDVDTY